MTLLPSTEVCARKAYSGSKLVRSTFQTWFSISVMNTQMPLKDVFCDEKIKTTLDITHIHVKFWRTYTSLKKFSEKTRCPSIDFFSKAQYLTIILFNVNNVIIMHLHFTCAYYYYDQMCYNCYISIKNASHRSFHSFETMHAPMKTTSFQAFPISHFPLSQTSFSSCYC